MEMRGDVTDAGQTTNDDDEQMKIELLSQWKLEADFRNILMFPRYKSTLTFVTQCNSYTLFF